MAPKMKVVCPKCKAKLKFDPDKIPYAVARVECPGCKTVLRINKPSSPNEICSVKEVLPSQSANKPEQKTVINVEDPGAELLDLARKFEIEMGFADDDQDEHSEEVGNETGPVAENKKKEESAEGRKKIAEINGEAMTEISVKSGAAAEGSDCRDFKRVKFKKRVMVNNQIMVEALDISEDGLFLHTGRSFDDGVIVEVGIPTFGGSYDLVVQAKVMHNHRGIGMGLQFVDLDDKQKAGINKLINELEGAADQELAGRKKILLVGGTDTARNINKSKLVLDGFYVLQATSADEVFKMLAEEHPDAMVLEWQETTFNCKGLLAKIKENPDYDVIIRVVLSALTDSYVQREILDAGAHRCMAKMDTNPAKLSLILRQLIAERDS